MTTTKSTPKSKRDHGAGSLRQLPSGRWQARFRGPDGVRRAAPTTFETKIDATGWLKAQTRLVERGQWAAPEDGQRALARATASTTLAAYAEGWLAERDLKPLTRKEYGALLSTWILPDLGDVPFERLTPSRVRSWWAGLDASKPTRRAHAYSLLRSICTTAVADELLPSSPCRVRGAGASKTMHEAQIPTLDALDRLVQAAPPRLRPMLLLAAWAGLRFGELTELRKRDVDLDRCRVHVRRGVTRVGSSFVVGTTKSAAGKRTVALPPHLLPALAEHLDGMDEDALLFPSVGDPQKHMTASTFHGAWKRTREAAGLPMLHFHDLRHLGATLAAQTGATTRDLMARIGHSTMTAALRYQHAIEDRDAEIAAALSGFAAGNVVPLRPVQRPA